MSTDSPDIRKVRLAKNQALFRNVNERVGRVVQQLSAGAPVSFVCECAIMDCARQIELTRDEYEGIRRTSTHFFVRPDHVFPEAEVVLEDRKQYVIVEKVGAAGRVAAAADPRQARISGVL